MTAPKLRPGLCLGPFTLLRKIALGGMAEIWHARRSDEEPSAVALKILRPEFARQKEFQTMFRDEATIALRLQHVHVVRVLDAHEEDGHFFQSMELIDGIDLRSILVELSRSRLWLPAPLALLIGQGIAAGLHFAHEMRGRDGKLLGIVHRDVSPHNVMINREGRVKVLDFGIARASTRLTKTRTGVIKGKLSYMAPEQALAAGVSPQTDIFALGIVMWEMFAMRRLFRADNDAAMLDLIVKADVPLLSPLNPEVPAPTEALIKRMLAAEPGDRPRSMKRVEDEIARTLLLDYPEDQSNRLALAKWLAPLLKGGRKPGDTKIKAVARDDTATLETEVRARSGRRAASPREGSSERGERSEVRARSGRRAASPREGSSERGERSEVRARGDETAPGDAELADTRPDLKNAAESVQIATEGDVTDLGDLVKK